MDEAYELKKELKKWEAQFVQEQNRKPKKVVQTEFLHVVGQFIFFQVYSLWAAISSVELLSSDLVRIINCKHENVRSCNLASTCICNL